MNLAPIPEDPDLIFSESELEDVNRTEEPGAKKARSKKKHFYTPAEDLELLREVYCTRPFLASYKDTPKKWSDCLTHLGWNFGVRSIRQRYETLYSSFLSAERKSAKSSGTEEVFDEKIQLLGHIKELIDATSLEKAKTSKRKLETEEMEKTKAQDIRNAAMNGMSRKDKLEPAPSVAKTRTSVNSDNQEVNDLLKRKLDDEYKFREDELKFKREKLSAMADEREKDRALEYKRLELQESNQKQQHVLMMELLSQLKGQK